jgi:hypothetical protein
LPVIEGNNLTACGGVPIWTANVDQVPSSPSLPVEGQQALSLKRSRLHTNNHWAERL